MNAVDELHHCGRTPPSTAPYTCRDHATGGTRRGRDHCTSRRTAAKAGMLTSWQETRLDQRRHQLRGGRFVLYSASNAPTGRWPHIPPISTPLILVRSNCACLPGSR